MQKARYILCRLLLFAILFATGQIAIGQAACFSVMAAESSEKTVRIGYYQDDGSFQDGFSDSDRKSGYAYEYYQAISTLTGWHYEYVYGTKAEVIELLLAGEVDMVAGIEQTDEGMDQVLFSGQDMGLNGEELYIAVNANRTDLLEELNLAQDKLMASSPNFTMLLWQKYYTQDSQQQILTEEEEAWLNEKGSLKIGYVRDNIPFSAQTEDGMPTGIVKELIAYISDYLSIPLIPVCYDNVTLMEEGLRQGEIDVAFPIYSDLWITESKGFYQTNSFISDRAMIVYQGDYRSDLIDKVAISETGLGQRYYISVYYPESETVYYRTKADSFAAIQNGEVNCMIGCSSILQHFFSEHPEYENFHIAYLDTSENFGMAVNRGENLLVGILNKAISQMDSAAITSAAIQYSNVQRKYTFLDFIERYAIAVIAILCTFFAILLWVFIAFRHKTKQFNAEQARTNAALETALGSANAANHAKTAFLSNMSHDIRTPMNGIIGMTAIAAAHIDDPIRVNDCLNKINTSGKHLMALINEVLDMSKIESGDIHLNEEAFDFSTLINDLITLNKPAADAKHHELVIHISNLSHEEVIGDSLRLQQVFINLVSNAIKYTPDGGRIELTLAEKPSGNPKLGCFEFSVRDNGIGMSGDYLPHVFDAFTRAQNSTMTRIEGTGLGMAIARNIIQMMGGDITVESVLNKGSTFTATMYLKLQETETLPPENFAGLEVLFVNDDLTVGESAKLLLSELGVKSEWVLSVREALERIDAKRQNGSNYFAILMDWEMSDMDGISATKKLRGQVGNDLPIIIISSCDWSAIEAEAKQAGVTGFIGKPLFKSRLLHMFNHLLGNKSQEGTAGLKELTEETDFSGKRALLAEDNEINAEIAIEVLNMIGLEVDWAHNGKEAVEQMQASLPGYYDCIFMDIQMPVMNGLDAAKNIRLLPHPDAKTIPIFAMTANAFVEDVQAVLNAGMNEHIAKPLDFDILIKTLTKYLKKDNKS